MYDIFFSWAFEIGMTIKEKAPSDKGEDLLRKLIFNIRAEETPGRFLDKLSETITEYKSNRNINLDLWLHPKIYSR